MPAIFDILFLSTLSLRRATAVVSCTSCLLVVFLSTLSLRRATAPQVVRVILIKFLSTLSLRRATGGHQKQDGIFGISIHALLAESDLNELDQYCKHVLFLSTLSLRRATTSGGQTAQEQFVFLSTLSLRRATCMSSRLPSRFW